MGLSSLAGFELLTLVFPPQEETSHVMLRPSTQSLICDSNLIAERLGRAGSLACLENKIFYSALNNAPAFYVQRWR
jgi:hypothetical protein